MHLKKELSGNGNKATIPASDIFKILMGTETLNQLRSKVLMLPESERAELAHALVISLNSPVDANAVEEWDREILRRLAEIDTGAARYIDRDEFRQRIKARLDNQ